MYKQIHGGWLITINTPDYWEVDLMANLIQFGVMFNIYLTQIGL